MHRPYLTFRPPKLAPHGVPIAPEQLSPYFASIMQAAALGYMCAPNTSPIVGMSGFVANPNAGVGADAPRKPKN